MKNLLDKKEENRKKMCYEELFENILKIIRIYTPLIIQKKKVENIIVSEAKNAKPRLFNAIFVNLFKVLTLLTIEEDSKEIMTKFNFIGTISDTISKPGIFSKIY